MIHKQLAMAIGALVLSFGALSLPAQSASQKCTSEECACEEALRQNTVEALETFLRKYPHSAQGKSACAALAVPPGNEDEIGGESSQKDSRPAVQSSNSAYGG